MINKLGFIFSGREKRRLALLLFIIIVGSFLELMGVTIFMPFIEIIMDENAIQNNEMLLRVYDFLISIPGKPFWPPLRAVSFSSIFLKMYL